MACFTQLVSLINAVDTGGSAGLILIPSRWASHELTDDRDDRYEYQKYCADYESQL